ncbi:MAG TPA: hypothetical protein VNM48_11595, partial [Chloroflexota bacterium]|nr:hypothetical protein [Chloroflexota bacterium]
MSLRRPPSRPGRRDPRDPGDASIDLAPDETIDGATLDDLDELDELEELENRRAPAASPAARQRVDGANGHRTGNGESANRARAFRTGGGVPVAAPEVVEDDGLGEP